MYAELSYGITLDEELLSLAAHTQLGQPPPNNLFAAVQYLLFCGADHPLRAHYPALSGQPRPREPAFPAFRSFCREHRPAIEELVRTRRTQTNVVRRSAVLIPAFARIFASGARPLALVEVGTSAGLNLCWDSFHVDYRLDGVSKMTFGREDSPLCLSADLRAPMPSLPAEIAVSSRVGIDTHPIDIGDPDAILWLRSLIWPEHIERHGWFESAVSIAHRIRPRVEKGDAVTRVEELVAEASADAIPVVFATHVLYQFSREAVSALVHALARAGQKRALWMVAMEGTGADCSELIATRFEAGRREAHKLADVSPHGRWLHWLDSEEANQSSASCRFWAKHGESA